MQHGKSHVCKWDFFFFNFLFWISLVQNPAPYNICFWLLLETKTNCCINAALKCTKECFSELDIYYNDMFCIQVKNKTNECKCFYIYFYTFFIAFQYNTYNTLQKHILYHLNFYVLFMHASYTILFWIIFIANNLYHFNF